MSKISHKCHTPSCHRHVKVDDVGQAQLRQMAAEANATVALMCPKCYLATLDEDAPGYVMEMPAGEMMADLLLDSPRWRTIILPRSEITVDNSPWWPKMRQGAGMTAEAYAGVIGQDVVRADALGLTPVLVLAEIKNG